MVCIAAILLLQPSPAPSQKYAWRTELATVPAHILKTKVVAGVRPVKVYVDNARVVRGMRALSWTYEVPTSYNKVLDTLLKEGFSVFAGTYRGVGAVKPITTRDKYDSGRSAFSHETPGVRTWVTITAGKVGPKSVTVKGTETRWTTISIMQDPKIFGPMPDWPKEGKADTTHWPKPPVKLLSGKTAVTYQTWATAAAGGQDYTYIVSESPAKVAAKLEKEFGKPSDTYRGPSFNIGLVNKWRWRVRAKEVWDNPEATFVVVSEYRNAGDNLGPIRRFGF